ncbi:MAG: hypothetical protein ABI977_12570 [Acidobacteriota bacterium]
MREQATALFLAGHSVADIARRLKRCERSIYNYIESARLQIIAGNRQHFEDRLTLLLDDTFDALAVQAMQLADGDFLSNEDPARIRSLAETFGLFSDKAFLLTHIRPHQNPSPPRRK